MKVMIALLLLGTGLPQDADAGRNQQRSLRKTRWTIVLPKDNPDAFMKKLVDLQAMLLLPEGEASSSFLLCDNLQKRPAEFRRIDLPGVNALNRLWFISHDQAGRGQIAQGLQLSAVPPWYALFIPVELEVEMLRKETAHQGLSEDQLNARKLLTVFEVEKKGSGWSVGVLFQGPKKQ